MSSIILGDWLFCFHLQNLCDFCFACLLGSNATSIRLVGLTCWLLLGCLSRLLWLALGNLPWFELLLLLPSVLQLPLLRLPRLLPSGQQPGQPQQGQVQNTGRQQQDQQVPTGQQPGQLSEGQAQNTGQQQQQLQQLPPGQPQQGQVQNTGQQQQQLQQDHFGFSCFTSGSFRFSRSSSRSSKSSSYSESCPSSSSFFFKLDLALNSASSSSFFAWISISL